MLPVILTILVLFDQKENGTRINCYFFFDSDWDSDLGILA